MCLLIAVSGVVADWPLIVAANRDERYERPAEPAGVLHPGPPRIVGGRDLRAGGTWLAVNDRGVVAALTNKPADRDPAKRSRGEIPLVAAGAPSAWAGMDALAGRAAGGSYGPCWVLAGDRSALYALDVTGAQASSPQILPPGVHVLENKPLGAPSAKVDRVHRLLGDVHGQPVRELVTALRGVLADHRVNVAPADDTEASRLASQVSACCVHTEEYGTRSSTLVLVPRSPAEVPRMWASWGPSCAHPLTEVTGWA